MWEEIREEIFENDQMDIYEKMCLLVLISLGEDIRLSSEDLARYMGCGVVTAKKAFEALRIKGYITGENQTVSRRRSHGNVISQEETQVAETISQTFMEEVDSFREGFFKADERVTHEIYGQTQRPDQDSRPVEGNREGNRDGYRDVNRDVNRESIKSQAGQARTEEEERRALLKDYLLGNSSDFFVSQKEKKMSLVDEVIELLDEKISFKQANIILGFAENDINLIRRKYQQAKKSQVSDKIGVLINLLQTKESAVIKQSQVLTEDKEAGESQINKSQILKMQAYQKNKKW